MRVLISLLLIMIAIESRCFELEQADQIFLSVSVNGVSRGDVLALIEENASTVWLNQEDFEKLRIEIEIVSSSMFMDEKYLRIDRSDVLNYELDLQMLVIKFEVNPVLLSIQRFNFSNVQAVSISKPPGFSTYLNYNISYLDAGAGQRAVAMDMNLTASLNEWVLKSEHSYQSNAEAAAHTRLSSYAFRDWPENSVRLSIGDTQASSGQFGRGGSIAGIKLEKLFGLKPDYISSPLAQLNGSVSTRSTADIFVDGTKVRTVDLEPGRFEFRDIYYYSGLRNIDIEITDISGNKRVLASPYYFSDNLLGDNLHEYSYAAGLKRRYSNGYNSYSGYQFSAVHRYGLSDNLTFGIQGEASANYQSIGLSGATRLGQFGVASSRTILSHSPYSGKMGHAQSLQYSYSGGKFSLAGGYTYQSKLFNLVEDKNSISIFSAKPEHQLNAVFSIGIRKNQSLSLNASYTSFYDNTRNSNLGLRYNWSVMHGVNLDASLGHRADNFASGIEAGVNLSFAFGKNWNTSSRLERSHLGNNKLFLSRSRSIPGGLGTGGRISYERTNTRKTRDIYLQHNANKLSLAFSGRHADSTNAGKSMSGRIQSYGSLAFNNGNVYFSRAINRSFASIDTNGLAGIRVYQNNQLAGKTNSKGKLIIPSVGDYARNQIRLDDRDIPMDYQLTNIERTIAPRTGMGVNINFDIERVSAIGGYLLVNESDGKTNPLKLAEVTIYRKDKEFKLTTGPDGDFYMDDIQPGQYIIKAKNFAHSCSSRFQFSEDQLPFAELGNIYCD